MIGRMRTHNPTHLLPAHFVRPIEGFIMEESLADLLLYAVIAESVAVAAWELDMMCPPVRDKVRLALKIGAAEVARCGLTGIRFSRPLVA